MTLEVLLVFFFTSFLAMIERRYIRTFFSTLTSKMLVRQLFVKAVLDEEKIKVLSTHPAFYASYRDEVKFFIQGSWAKWCDEKPGWFTERVKATIPSAMIPNDEEEKRQEARRKSSATSLAAEALTNLMIKTKTKNELSKKRKELRSKRSNKERNSTRERSVATVVPGSRSS